MRIHWAFSLWLICGGCVAAQQPSGAPIVTPQEWKRLHNHAKTAEELRACAQWCRRQAEQARKKEGAYQTQMQALHNRPANHIGPKYPPTQDELREAIGYYHGQTRHWAELAVDYDRKAAAH